MDLTLSRWTPIVLLFLSNIFMTFAWYGHLRFETKPLLLLSHSLFLTSRYPPALVLERQSALFSPWSSSITWSQTCWQAPM